MKEGLEHLRDEANEKSTILFQRLRGLREQWVMPAKMMSPKRNITGQLDQANYSREHETGLRGEYDAGIVGRSSFCTFQDDAA